MVVRASRASTQARPPSSIPRVPRTGPRSSSSPRARAPSSIESAARAGLRLVDDAAPGIRRRGRGRRARYFAADGREIRDRATLARIDALKIPPAWREVWICPDPLGHMQASGRDARGRKQFRYHPRWRETRDAAKFARTIAFAQALPRIRAAVDRDLRGASLSRERVLAAVVRLLDRTLIRVGNDEYARDGHFGLTTLRREHVRTRGDRLSFRFLGKSGRERRIEIRDSRAARVVRRCCALRGRDVFEYIDARGECRDVKSADVNAYLREISGGDFTAKDFRTWAATVLAGLALQEIVQSEAPPRSCARQIATAIRAVAEQLGNTPAVCRASYVDPRVLRAHEEGALAPALARPIAGRAGLRAEEAAVLSLLCAASQRAETARHDRGARAHTDSARRRSMARRLRTFAA